MAVSNIGAVKLQRLEEQIRQEKEVFDQRKIHEERWFTLRLRMGYMAIVLLPLIMLVTSYIILHHELFPAAVVTSSAAALLVDVLGLLISIWKLVLNPTSMSKAEPVISGFEQFAVEEAADAE